MTKKKSETTKEPPIKELSKKSNARKLNKEIIELIKGYVRVGIPIEKMCKLVNIDKVTFYRWKRQGEEDKKNGIESLESYLCNSLIELQYFAYNLHMTNIERLANQGNLQASIFYLKSRYPEDFSENPELRKTKTKNKGKQVESDVDEIINKLNEKFND